MGKSQNVIEINGRKYDAVTGKMLGGAQQAVHAHKPASSGIAMDGVVRRKPATPRPVKHQKRVHPQKSATLMRRAVKKPSVSAAVNPSSKKTAKHPQAHFGIVTPSEITEERLERAHKVSKSPLISRFSFGEPAAKVIKKIGHLKVREHPRQENRPAPAHNSAPTTAAHSPTQEPKTTANQLVEKALARAKSHTEAAHKVKKHGRISSKLGLSRKVAAVSSSLLALLLLGAFFAYQNIPNFAMRVASARAGFNANMPGYRPSGFSFKSPIKYSPGEVSITFRSNTSDDRAFTLTQRKTNWNSDALLANFVLGNDNQYQTFLEQDQTVYTYGNGNATWVKDGVWYQLESEADLTSDQVLRIAQSI